MYTHSFRFFQRTTKLIAFILAMSASAFASAGFLSVSDTTFGEPVWNRPLAGNPPIPPTSTWGTEIPFDVTHFRVDLADLYTFESDAQWDNYSFLYHTAFDPTQPFLNVIIGNDDNPNIGQSGFQVNLSAGIDYFFVLTGLSNSSFGQYQLSISAPTGTAFVPSAEAPEPVTFALVGLGLTGLGLSRRKKV